MEELVPPIQAVGPVVEEPCHLHPLALEGAVWQEVLRALVPVLDLSQDRQKGVDHQWAGLRQEGPWEVELRPEGPWPWPRNASDDTPGGLCGTVLEESPPVPPRNQPSTPPPLPSCAY